MLPVHCPWRSRPALGFVTGAVVCLIYHLLVHTEHHKRCVTELMDQTIPNKLNATRITKTVTTVDKNIEEPVLQKLDENNPQINTSSQYVGERPICSREKLLIPCSTVRGVPAKGDLKIQEKASSYDELEEKHGKDLLSGGYFRPTNCTPSQKVAIIVPYRERSENLKSFINHIHPFLKKQKLEYMIIVVEQDRRSRMNRGMLRNIGFIEGQKICNFSCVIFNDVDTLPLREANYYTCGNNPRHHAAAVARFNFQVPYTNIFGGVVSLKPELFQKANGYSNVYFDWGGEDDDMFYRLKNQNMTIERYSMNVSRYGDLTHAPSQKSDHRVTHLTDWKKRAKTDGLNSLVYKRHLVEFRKLYTWIYVGIDEKDILQPQGLKV